MNMSYNEYIQSLIPQDMERQQERLHVLQTLRQAEDEIDRRDIVPESVIDIWNEP